MSEKYRERLAPHIASYMTIFGSTSPSYLIMQSLDLCNKYLAENFRTKLKETVRHVDKTKDYLRTKGISIKESEKLKIIIDAAASGYTGEAVSDELRRYDIECEYADRQYIVLMFSSETRAVDYERVCNWADNSIIVRNRKKKIEYSDIYPEKIKRSMTIREAVFAPSEIINVDRAEGRVCASETISCPPAVPIAVSGEVIDRNMIELFRGYDIDKVCVVS